MSATDHQTFIYAEQLQRLPPYPFNKLARPMSQTCRYLVVQDSVLLFEE